MTLSRPDGSDAEESRLRDEKQGQDTASRPRELVEYPLGSVEFSAPLESSVSLEAPRMRYVVVSHPIVSDPIVSDPPASTSTVTEPQATPRSSSQPVLQVTEATPPTNESSPTVIQLLDERVVVNRRHRKVGEVVVRKEIETHIVEVPIRREKLIVEQVSPEYEQLAVIELGRPQVNEFNSLETDDLTSSSTVSGNFSSADAAIQFLQAIATHSNSSLTTVQVSVVLADENLQAAYQRWLEEYSSKADAS